MEEKIVRMNVCKKTGDAFENVFNGKGYYYKCPNSASRKKAPCLEGLKCNRQDYAPKNYYSNNNTNFKICKEKKSTWFYVIIILFIIYLFSQRN